MFLLKIIYVSLTKILTWSYSTLSTYFPSLYIFPQLLRMDMGSMSMQHALTAMSVLFNVILMNKITEHCEELAYNTGKKREKLTNF